MPMPGQIFISYSRVDTKFVTRLIDDLSKQGLDIWMDQSDIGAGQRWDSVIQDALEACGLFIIILSPHSVESENALDELSFAINSNKRIIPILLENCEIPYRIARIQFVNFTNDYETGFRHLVSEITQQAPQRPITVKKRADSLRPMLWIAGIAAIFLCCVAIGFGTYMAYPNNQPTETPKAATVTPQPENNIPTQTQPSIIDTPTLTATSIVTDIATLVLMPAATDTATPTPMIITDKPDLIASGMQYSPNPAKNAQPIKIQVKVTNNGTALAGRFTVVWLSNQTRPGCNWTVSKLGVGESKNLNCQFTYDGNTTASYWTVLVVDSASQIAESDETNNSRDTTLKVAP